MSAKKVMIGGLSCLAAGIVIGLLVAPASGSETRQKISDAAGNLKKKIKRLRYGSDELDELKEVFEGEITGLKDDVRERVLHLIKAAKATGNGLKEQVLS